MIEKHEIKSEIEVFSNKLDLGKYEQLLVEVATKATQNAYAPYSKFQVGSAILLENNEIITGSNQENAVFPLGLCAERVTLFTYGNMNIDTKVIAIAVAAHSKHNASVSPFPCGSCRQVILEFEKRQKRDINILIISSDNKIYKVKSVKDILPFAFEGDFLK